MQQLKFQNQSLILNQMLKIAPWLGWNDHSLEIACKKLHLDKDYVYIIFPKGVSEILEYYVNQIIQNMITEFESLDLTNLKIKEKVYLAIKIILDQNFYQKLAIKRLVSHYLLLGRYIEGLKIVYRIVDNIWYSIQDRSTDFNFYSKRAILAKIYIDITIVWVNDKSKDNKKVLKYLRRKIDNLIKFSPKKIIDKVFNINNIPFFRLIKDKF